MNKSEFKAIQMIANKMDWQQKPVSETIEIIKQMVRNQQALELDTVGDCDGEEETLLTIALWDKDRLLSTTRVFDFESMVMWGVDTFCEDMGMDYLDFRAMMDFYELSDNYLAECYEAEEEYAQLDALYNDMEIEELHYWQHARMMGWE